MRTAFVELRGSALLKAPLRLTGEYRRPDGDTLVREVRAPYAETTTIRAGAVRIERDGRGARDFSLSRVPELAALQASFGALLSGDRALLEKHYRIDTRGSRSAWTLALAPRDAAVAGSCAASPCTAAAPSCAASRRDPTQGDLQRTLLAGAARTAETGRDAAALAALCTRHASPRAMTSAHPARAGAAVAGGAAAGRLGGVAHGWNSAATCASSCRRRRRRHRSC